MPWGSQHDYEAFELELNALVRHLRDSHGEDFAGATIADHFKLARVHIDLHTKKG